MQDVRKAFGGVTALDGVSFTGHSGSIHAVLGENGAGKSTLIKIIAGVISPDDGELYLDGRPVSFSGPKDAQAAGIACVFQELSLIPDLSIADNICITRPPGRLGLIASKQQNERAREILQRIGCGDIDPRLPVRDLPLSRRQLIEIGKALYRNPRLLILDEATSALTGADVENVYELLHRLKAEGMLLIYISHRMPEIEALADTCSVFRNGHHIETFPAGARSETEVVRMMIGRDIENVFPPKPTRSAMPDPALEVRELAWMDKLKGVSLSVGRGEIVGLGGLDGQGQRELLLALFGVLRGVSGDIRVDGVPVRLSGPIEAKSAGSGMALIPEDRKTEGLMLPMSVRDNLGMASLWKLAKGFVIDRDREAEEIDRMVKTLQIKVGSLDNPVWTLSGGNQQKVVIAKWLMTGARVILLNDPTRGIDVGTKQEIYVLLRRLADSGAAILLFSTDYNELIGCCERVVILYDGQVRAEFEGDAITDRAIVAASLNLSLDAVDQRGALQ
jgi:ribose transport system ATP-binding protein